MKQGHFSHAPTILRHWIPFEFSKEVADYPSTKPDCQTARPKRIHSSNRSEPKIFHNEKLFRRLEESKSIAPQFKLVFKNRSCKLFEPRRKINSGHLIKKILNCHLQEENLESKESAVYDMLYESELDKHYVYRYVGLEKPASSFSLVPKKREPAISCDFKKSRTLASRDDIKSGSLTTAAQSKRNSRTIATRDGQRRLTWLLSDGAPTPILSRRNSDLMISGNRAAKGEIVEHWKLKQAEIMDLMKRIKIG